MNREIDNSQANGILFSQYWDQPLPSSSSLPPFPNEIPLPPNQGSIFGFENHLVGMQDNNPSTSSNHRHSQSEIRTASSDIGFGMVGSDQMVDETNELMAMFRGMGSANPLLRSGEKCSSSTPAPMATQHTPYPPATPSNHPLNVGITPHFRHYKSQSMDCSSIFMPQSQMPNLVERPYIQRRNTISDSQLAEMAIVDPQKARRIYANREAVVRSKERKNRYTSDLKQQIQALQAKTKSLSTRVDLLQKDTSRLTSENSHLKLRLETMEEHARLKDALNDALKDEIQQMKMLYALGMKNLDPSQMDRLRFP